MNLFSRTCYLLLIAFLLVIAGCAAHNRSAADTGRNDVLYVCDCGPQCSCNTVSAEPGKCACGKDLKWTHVVKIEGDEALLCTCKQGCTCAIDAKDPSKCGCGMPLKRVSLKGTGIHFCNCGGSCFCNTVAAKAGQCRCGMPLKQSN
ncbi:hypothetical protein DESUT3_36280 [Desulfuromonas versatilis]|uniref:Uncharacterized protein n=1 Tax=Desulfuromonas versatilis TaxID=2802975 RepID=A0ABM8HZP9_9BACT|nr:hypothetical protein [Desulfuromonas versatilis]BCR06559.1 hypothetical protein DESUT3_36280 [Desulfuromonas versatilis]